MRILSTVACLMLILGTHLQAATKLNRLIVVDCEVEEQPFDFPIGPFVGAPNGENIYVGAAAQVGGMGIAQDFAIARVSRTMRGFRPVAPKTVTLNDKRGAENPLFDQGMAFFSLLQNNNQELISGAQEHLAVVSANDLQSIYLFLSIVGQTEVSVALRTPQNGFQDKPENFIKNIPDATGSITNAIQGLTSGPAPEGNGGYIFAGVNPAAGTFGDSGSGVAVAILGTTGRNTDSKSVVVLNILDGPTGQSLALGQNRATPLDRTSSLLKIGGDLASMQLNDLQYDVFLKRFYGALTVQAGPGAQDGARAVFSGQISQGNPLALRQIVPDTVFTGSLDAVVGAQQADVIVSVEKVRTIRTSTNLSYLIVVGSVGAPGTTGNQISAFPLVTGNAAFDGTIASKTAIPEDVFAPNAQCTFVGRVLKEPATQPDQMPRAGDPEVQVGGGLLPQGMVSEIVVRDDAIFVSVFEAEGDNEPGIFYSQALFDQNSKIRCWTTWKRAAGTIEPVREFSIDPLNAQTTFVTTSTAEDACINRTTWSDGAPDGLKPLRDALSTELSPFQCSGAAQGVREFMFGTPGLNQIAMTLVTSRNEIILAQTGQTIGGAQVPILGSGFGTVTRFTNGMINQNLPVAGSKIIGILGGVLDEIGPITTAEIVTNGEPGTQGWLVVGGSRGVAILSQPDGSGWDPATQLSNGFAGLRSGMSFKKLGEYCFVRKLINDGQFLYVLTDRQLDRIDLTQANVGLGEIEPTTLACPQVMGNVLMPTDAFLDLVVSEKLAILATTGGLLRVGNGQDIRMSDSVSMTHWTLINVPVGLRTIQQLIPFSTTGREQDVARGQCGGQLYILEGDRGSGQSRVNRFVVAPLEGQPITDTTVTTFQDFITKNNVSFIINYGTFFNLFATDGALYFSAVSRIHRQPPQLTLTPPFPEVRVGPSSAILGVSANTVMTGVSNGDIITHFARSSAAGSWVLSGNFGMRINE